MASHIDKQIIDAAITAFSSAGYCGATTKEIAKLAGVEERSLFRIFKSKDALFDAAVKSAIGSIQPRTAEIEFILARDGSEKGIRAAVRRFCEIIPGDFIRLREFAVLERRGLIADLFQHCFDDYGREFEKVLPAKTVEHLIGYCLQVRIFWPELGKKALLATVDSFVQMLLTGVEKSVPKAGRTR